MLDYARELFDKFLVTVLFFALLWMLRRISPRALLLLGRFGRWWLARLVLRAVTSADAGSTAYFIRLPTALLLASVLIATALMAYSLHLRTERVQANVDIARGRASSMTLEELQREVDDLPFRSYVTTYSFMSAMSVAAIALFALIPWDAAAVAQIRFNIERTETWLRAVADREELESLYTLQSQVRDRESLIAYLTRHNELAMQFRLPRMDMAWVGATSSSPIAGKLEDRDDRVEID